MEKITEVAVYMVEGGNPEDFNAVWLDGSILLHTEGQYLPSWLWGETFQESQCAAWLQAHEDVGDLFEALEDLRGMTVPEPVSA